MKVAAGTLDASTKIYAVRVDAVHADAYRVLGGLGAETKPGEGKNLSWSSSRGCLFSLAGPGLQHEGCAVPSVSSAHAAAAGEEGGAGELAESEVAAKQPKKKRPPKKTVEQNLSNLNSAESERKCEVGGRSFRRSSSSSSSSAALQSAGVTGRTDGGTDGPDAASVFLFLQPGVGSAL